ARRPSVTTVTTRSVMSARENWKALCSSARRRSLDRQPRSMNAFQFDEWENLRPEAAMKSDSEIERDVRDELEWDPDLDATDIAVSVKSGVVTLAGFVKSYTDKYEAEAAAK